MTNFPSESPVGGRICAIEYISLKVFRRRRQMIRIELKRLYWSKGSYLMLVPISFVRENGLEGGGIVEVITNGEMLVRPLPQGKEREADDR